MTEARSRISARRQLHESRTTHAPTGRPQHPAPPPLAPSDRASMAARTPFVMYPKSHISVLLPGSWGQDVGGHGYEGWIGITADANAGASAGPSAWPLPRHGVVTRPPRYPPRRGVAHPTRTCVPFVRYAPSAFGGYQRHLGPLAPGEGRVLWCQAAFSRAWFPTTAMSLR